MIGRGERQVRAVHGDAAALQVEQPARAAEIVQQVPVDMQQVGIVAEVGDHMRVPDLGKQRAGSHGKRLVVSLVSTSRERAIRLVNASTVWGVRSLAPVRGQTPCPDVCSYNDARRGV